MLCSAFLATLVLAVAPPLGAREIVHAALRMSDTEKTLAFYRDFLGFAERFRTNKVPGAPNVYYRRGQTPADVEKEKEGTLMLVDLRIGPTQSLELFAGKSDTDFVVHHVAVGVTDLEATRSVLEHSGVKVPPAPSPDGKPLAAFFARDPNGRDIEVVRPREAAGPPPAGDELGTRLVEVHLPGNDPAKSTDFYAGAMGFTVSTAAEDLVATTDSGDRIVLRTSSDVSPRLVFEVDDLEQARQWLEARPARAAYAGRLEIAVGPDGRRALAVEDPDGLAIHFVQRGEVGA